ncbi:hypothetical protein [Sutcliffiella horikoshii]|uniref:hypothetical protein n=1 Tax=Sutcliffiella horikoshii TaxID=79883 RepID=UPI001F314497|nr:hypothetical protein [Sutcliffiella horikoshii]MCG1023828.1 hypothetical protein [Sutcliffiella horikoshii]
MNTIKINLMLIALFLVLVGCQEKELSETAAFAKEYLELQGYNVLTYEGQLESYKITKYKVDSIPYHIHWSLPGNNPEPYYNKIVEVEKFIVNNHPLDNWECCDGVKSKGKVSTYVYVVEGQIVGGYSTPYGIKPSAGVVGGNWSLDGKSKE